MTPDLRTAYRAARSRGAVARVALMSARHNLERLAAATAAKRDAEKALGAVVDRRRCAPENVAATDALAKARRAWSAAWDACNRGARAAPGMADGAVFSAYGENRVVWVENPGTYLRFIGRSRDVAPRRVDHRGWWLEPDGDGETVSGVVYQLPARDGRVRLLYGYADPFNCDTSGRGPALLSLSIVESDDFDDAKADAAAWGDAMAKRMAEAEREYREAYGLGRDARNLIADARETMREVRRLIAATRDACAKGAFAAGAETLAAARSRYGHAQALRRQFRGAIQGPYGENHFDSEAFREGYANV